MPSPPRPQVDSRPSRTSGAVSCGSAIRAGSPSNSSATARAVPCMFTAGTSAARHAAPLTTSRCRKDGGLSIARRCRSVGITESGQRPSGSVIGDDARLLRRPEAAVDVDADLLAQEAAEPAPVALADDLAGEVPVEERVLAVRRARLPPQRLGVQQRDGAVPVEQRLERLRLAPGEQPGLVRERPGGPSRRAAAAPGRRARRPSARTAPRSAWRPRRGGRASRARRARSTGRRRARRRRGPRTRRRRRAPRTRRGPARSRPRRSHPPRRHAGSVARASAPTRRRGATRKLRVRGAERLPAASTATTRTR